MGLYHFYSNNPNNINVDANGNLYFGDNYNQSKKRSLSDEYSKNHNNNKSIDSYFSNKNFHRNISFFCSNNKDDNPPINNSSVSKNCTSLNQEIKTSLFSSIKKRTEFSLDKKYINFRRAYYNKINNKNISNLKKKTIKNNTLFIFDWDDTLFFTTHINPTKNNIFFYVSKSEEKLMNTIEYYVVEILNKALSKGTVLIISNSADGWVRSCANFYYPNLIPILDKITIISSRELYENKFPTDPIIWKVKTFNDLKQIFNFEKCKVSNIICIGDDNSEIIAAKKLGESFDNCLVKTIKFRDKPNLKDLIKQIILINEQILRIYNYPKSLTIQVDKKKNPKKSK